MSSVPRHSEEELRQQWAFLDALVDRQAASLKSGIQDPEEDDLAVAMVAPDANYLEEISTLTQRVTTLEDERSTLLRRIDLAEEARMAAESARAAAERELAEERSRVPDSVAIEPVAAEPVAPHVPVASQQPVATGTPQDSSVVPKGGAAKPRRKSWWQRIRE